MTAAAGRRERLVFRAAACLLALHVLDSAFVGLEPGARASDHLWAGLVPLLLAVLAAVYYPRLRAGSRALLALLFGAVGIVAGGVALADSVAHGPRGDDVTGLASVPAAVALLGLGVWLLWRSRKPGGRVVLRRGLLALAGVVALFELVLPLDIAIVATQRPRDSVRAADLGRAYRSVAIRTSDGLTLAGWYVPSRNGAAVITFPDRNWTLGQTRMLVRHGYGVLALDMRGYGQSQGDPNAFGWGATKDIDAGVRFLQAQPDVRAGRIGGLGLSVGGEQMIEAAAENPGLRAVVSEGAGERSLRETLERGAGAALLFPQQAVQTAALAVMSGHTPPPSLRDLAARVSPRALFLISAGHGAGGEDLNPVYYRAARQPKAFWQIPEAKHTGGLEARPAEYERRVTGFFDLAL
jgi:hypothetical protein